MIEATIRSKTVSVANLRLHWAGKAMLAKAHRGAARAALGLVAPIPPKPPLTVILTRVAPRRLDGDNLQSALKATRDGIADWLGLDDGHAGIDWQYEQTKGDPNKYSVLVEVI